MIQINRKHLKCLEVIFLFAIYAAGLYLRLWPRLHSDPHLLTLNADIWERVAMSQYILDHGFLPEHCLRYIAYCKVPFWYPPLGPILTALMAMLFKVDIPTVCSRIMPFIESLAPLPFYLFVRFFYGRITAVLGTIILALTPAFIYWTGICTPTSATLFFLPLYALMLGYRYRMSPENTSIFYRATWIFSLGVILAVNFLFHLTYLMAIPVILLLSLPLFLNTPGQGLKFLDLILAMVLSQILTSFWWFHSNLYYWWIFKITTSTGMQDFYKQLKDYGMTAGILTVSLSVVFILSLFRKKNRNNRFSWIPLVWLIIPLLEVENEHLIRLFNRPDLTWSNIFKPLEGFRFFPFLAQPLALMSACVLGYLVKLIRNRWLSALLILTLAGIMFYDVLAIYHIDIRFNNPGINMYEYKAAKWFRTHSDTDSRIMADYYRVQMLAGVCGGKALLGALFPLKHSTVPFISVPPVVNGDIYRVYASDSPFVASYLMKRYGCDHVFISNNLLKGGYFAYDPKQRFGINADTKKFEDKRFFSKVYDDGRGTVIYRRKPL